ncbi:putative quinol monooxygenase [Sphingosinicella soli]|uniref:Quinol monooxygenase YgiN n=1 Tax=Sphingosinicella soli TaxID=333708 RepID=A0A7W7B4H9_9SPHN|nr:antibiotic biosynthesis monooxygenase [Sphingosinicella soli]MBB4633864.1 quinol monooxygenase YgiN [Sphingosinicella soli]
MSFTYIARLRIRPEAEAEFLSAIDDMTAATAADPSTLDYKVFTRADDPYSYVFYESYVDEAADEHHRTGPTTGPIIARMVACIDDSGFSQEFWNPVSERARGA